jgi:hypothetical protein
VTSADDLSTGIDGLPPTEGMRYRLDGGARVVVRPSGTEPKLKCYLEVVEPVPDGDVDAGRARAEARLRLSGQTSPWPPAPADLSALRSPSARSFRQRTIGAK